MNIINEINHEILGKIYCIADDKRHPWQWVKKEDIKIFNTEAKEIIIEPVEMDYKG